MSEFDTAGALFKSPPKSLAAFMAAGEEHARLGDLRNWRRFSATNWPPPSWWTWAVRSRHRQPFQDSSTAQNLVLKSFLDIVYHPVPPLELLTLRRNSPKRTWITRTAACPTKLPPSLLHEHRGGMVRLDRRISQLGDAELERGLNGPGQPWVEPRIQNLLDQASAKTGGASLSRPSAKGRRLETMSNDFPSRTPHCVPPCRFLLAGPIAELVGHRCFRRQIVRASGHFVTLRSLRVLGSGGMGIVLLARDTEGPGVAIKMVRPELVPEPSNGPSFRQGSRALAKIAA